MMAETDRGLNPSSRVTRRVEADSGPANLPRVSGAPGAREDKGTEACLAALHTALVLRGLRGPAPEEAR